MSSTKLKGNPVKLSGEFATKGNKLENIRGVKSDLSEFSLKDHLGKKVVLNIFPSIDTAVCATSVRKFNQLINDLPNALCVCVSRDLPFAFSRFCGAEGLNNVVSVSDFRYHDFGKSLGLELVEGPLSGLLARAVVVLNEEGVVVHAQLVEDIVLEPNYDEAIASLK